MTPLWLALFSLGALVFVGVGHRARARRADLEAAERQVRWLDGRLAARLASLGWLERTHGPVGVEPQGDEAGAAPAVVSAPAIVSAREDVAHLRRRLEGARSVVARADAEWRALGPLRWLGPPTRRARLESGGPAP